MRFELVFLVALASPAAADEIADAKRRWAESPHGPLLERILPPTFEERQLPQPRSRGARLPPVPRAARSQAPHRRGMAYRRRAHAGKHAVDEPCRRLPAGARRAAAARRGDQRLPGKVCEAPLSSVSCR